MSKRTTEAARARIAAQREALRKQEQRKRITMIVTIAVVVVIAAVFTVWTVRQGTSEEASGGSVPVTVEKDGTVVMAQPGVTAPVVDVFEDFQCPACKQFEEVSGPTLKNLATEGKAKIVFHPITIFSQEPTKGNSLRAASAARCVTDGQQWLAYHDKLYANQPSESVTGFTADELIKWGKEAGVTAPDFDNCVREQRNVAAHQEFSSKTMSTQKLGGTPTLKLNGKELDTNVAFVPSSLREAVESAGK
ncbi:membrane protein [Microbispora rosea subsp. aerata]|nr:thioredoxin domain-containing protein [Microbispora rosea]GGO02317.1 membrane protein [Microbispora rosea subsp. aerata]GIH54649.1 membrane protein [Microbispora rosea subsp. aerata]GLJ87392.1 membrane protein [Microbispora rosea subsp. aerata]